MRVSQPIKEHGEPASIHDQAIDNLRFIRTTLESAGSFTAVPGRGGLLVGAIAVAAAVAAHRAPSPRVWLVVWVVAALVAGTCGIVAIVLKMRRIGGSPFTLQGRRFALSYLPALGAGAVLTAVLGMRGDYALLPPVWLLMYGTAVVAGGAFSVRVVPLMGVLFMLAGAAAFLLPASWGDTLMAVGFGGLHLIFGLIIARHHGG